MLPRISNPGGLDATTGPTGGKEGQESSCPSKCPKCWQDVESDECKACDVGLEKTRIHGPSWLWSVSGKS